MRAVITPGDGTLAILERPEPVPGDGQVLVAVHAAGLNRADLSQRAGKYPAPPGWPADIPGLEYAGEVISTGSGETRFRVGDRVMGLVGGGAHAERVVVDELEAIAIPAHLSFHEAAAIPEAFLTAWDALAIRGRVGPGERVLIHAVGSGVGTAAIQLARLMGAVVIGTSRTEDKLERAASLGMTMGVSTASEGWEKLVGDQVDVIIDPLGASAFGGNLALLAPRGRLVVIGTLTGATGASLDLGLMIRRRLEVIGTAMRVRALSERVELVARFGQEVLPAFAAGGLGPVIDRVMPFESIGEAHELMGSNATFGKVILSW